MRNIKIEMTEEQQTWLLRLINREWDAELDYQYQNRNSDTEYLEEMLDVYEALLGKTNSIFTAMANQFDIEDKLKELKELKENCKNEA